MTLHAILQATGRALTRLARRLTDRSEDFTCGQCARQDSCGLPPNKDCLYKLMVVHDRERHGVRGPKYTDYVLTRRPL